MKYVYRRRTPSFSTVKIFHSRFTNSQIFKCTYQKRNNIFGKKMYEILQQKYIFIPTNQELVIWKNGVASKNSKYLGTVLLLIFIFIHSS